MFKNRLIGELLAERLGDRLWLRAASRKATAGYAWDRAALAAFAPAGSAVAV